MSYATPVCGNPVSDELKRLCKKCAANSRRAQTRDANRRAAEAEHQKRVEGWTKRMEQAAQSLGISASLDMLGFNYVEKVVISLEDFEKLARSK
jgi:hypothetical protein